MRYSILMVVIGLLAACAVTKRGTDEKADWAARIDSLVLHHPFNGVILLTKGDDVLYHKAIGYADLAAKTPVQMDDQFVIGSISKQITAVLVLREYEKRTIALDDKIGQYLPDIQLPWANDVTIHHLLTHTHGIVALDQPLGFAPGTQFQYSQLGFELLARMLEVVTGSTFEQLSNALFAQYGLKNTFHPDNKTYARLVKGYEADEHGHLVFTPHSLENYVAAGAFISTAHDLNHWNQLLHSGQLVQPETLQLMKTPYATRLHPIFDAVAYGYGLLFKSGEENRQIGALGYVPGYVSACYYYPETNMSLVVLQNTAHDLDNFKMTFRTHTAIMDLVRGI